MKRWMFGKLLLYEREIGRGRREEGERVEREGEREREEK